MSALSHRISRDANPGTTIGEQVTLDVTNNATGETVRIRIDNLVRRELVRTGLTNSLMRSLAPPPIDQSHCGSTKTVTPNQAKAYQWISSGQNVTVVPTGRNAVDAGYDQGHRSVSIQVWRFM